MRWWLDKPCSELSREWLLDEHQSTHAYFGGYLKTPSRWSKHKLIGPMDALVLAVRHQEQVNEMEKRGYKHETPLQDEDVYKVLEWRRDKELELGERFNSKGAVVYDEEVAKLQTEYIRRVWNEVQRSDLY
jgi:hypothetical protein